MESKDITVTLAPGHAVTLTTDAPDIKGLVDEIVKVKDIFDPDELKIDCEHEEKIRGNRSPGDKRFLRSSAS